MKKIGLVLISFFLFLFGVGFVNAVACTNPPSTCNCEIYSSITLDRDLLDCHSSGGVLSFMSGGETPDNPIVLDCNGHRLYASSGICVSLGDGDINNIIIKNCKFECPVSLDLAVGEPRISTNITVENNEFLMATNNWHMRLRGIQNSKIIDNILFRANYGILIGATPNQPDLYALPSINNAFYHNNFVGIDHPYNNYHRYSNYWSYNGEGNYWSNYDEESEGCYDFDGNGFCDNPLQLDINNYDYTPFTHENGWLIIDVDGDTIPDNTDNCPYTYNQFQYDFDRDNTGDWCDNCPLTNNPDQLDSNDNERGDVCENLRYMCRAVEIGVIDSSSKTSFSSFVVKLFRKE